MDRKRLAAFVMTGCLFTSAGCSTFGSGSTASAGGSSGGCCGHSGGLFSRMFGSSNRADTSVAATPVSYGASGMGGMSGPDCPCSNHGGGGEGMFHPAVMSGGAPVTGDMMMGQPTFQNAPIQGNMIQGPIQQGPMQGPPMGQYPVQPGPITTPGVPPNNPGQPPRIQPVPMAPSGVAPSGGMAPAAPWGPQ